ncbi:MAG: methylated-DNA--[protein]-cysteine S-methyltransferase [Sarcina sp.]
MEIFNDIFNTKIGKLRVTANSNEILEINFYNERDNLDLKTNEITDLAKKQLLEYFKGERKLFDLPLKIVGTDFQKNVWNSMLDIPYGEVCTYKEIAININKEKSSRAVGGAANKNKFMIVIPCHRVIGSNHKLTGYAGGLSAKEKLLELEKTNY